MRAIFEFSYNPYIQPLIVAFVLLTVVLSVTWRFSSTQLGMAFVRMIVSLQIWTLGFAIEVAAVQLEGKLFWANIQFLGILLLPVSWLEITLLFTGQAKYLKRYAALLFPLLFLMLAVIWTNGIHHLFRGAPHLDCATGPFCVLDNDYGAFFYLYAALVYILFLSSLGMMAHSLAITKPLYRQQLILLIASLFLPLLTDVLYVLGISPIPNFNFTPMTFSVAVIFVAIALFRFRLFNTLPLAYDMIIENMRDGVLVLDSHNAVVDINPAAQRLLGIDGKQAIGEQVEVIFRKMPEIVERFLDVPSAKTVVQIGRDGNERYFDVVISPVDGRGAEYSGRTVTIHDTTERFRLYQEVERLAQTDPLTGLFNRRYFFESAERELLRSARYKKSISLLMLDLDGFKMVNDTYGHGIGDSVLREVAVLLKDTLRRNDLVGRYGGEEFIILLPEIDMAGAYEVAERLRANITTKSMQANEAVFWITASIGISAFGEGDTFSSLVDAADAALYRAKALGKNRVERS